MSASCTGAGSVGGSGPALTFPRAGSSVKLTVVCGSARALHLARLRPKSTLCSSFRCSIFLRTLRRGCHIAFGWKRCGDFARSLVHLAVYRRLPIFLGVFVDLGTRATVCSSTTPFGPRRRESVAGSLVSMKTLVVPRLLRSSRTSFYLPSGTLSP